MSENESIITNLLSLYMEYVIENVAEYPSVEGYCAFAEVDSTLFHQHFSSIEDIEQKVWGFMLSNAIETIHSDPNYMQFKQDDKLLSLLYTFFENLTLNRSYFARHLDMRKGFRQKRALFSQLKSAYQNYINQTIDQDSLIAKGIEQFDFVKDICDRTQQEAFWVQLLILIDFWQKDESEDQSKTDVAIEKSVRAAIDILEAAPVRSVLDLGKFIWQERYSNSKNSA